MDLMAWLRAQWDRVLAWALIGVGAVALLVGWLGVSHTAYLVEQIPYVISAGLLGIFLLGLGATVWISADLRDEWRKLDRIDRALERHADDPTVVLDAVVAGRPETYDAGGARRRRPAATAGDRS